MKTLIILSAMPGSGKSTWANKYQEEHPHTLIVSSDQIRYELTGATQDFSKQKEVWELFSLRIHEYAKRYDDVTVILDALNDLNSLREKYVKDKSATYKSSNTKIVKVDSNGMVTGVAKGSATITIDAHGAKATVVVYVR